MTSRSAFEQAARLAREAGTGLRAGDSLHLAVAIEIGAAGLATADGNLGANARHQGVNTVKF